MGAAGAHDQADRVARDRASSGCIPRRSGEGTGLPPQLPPEQLAWANIQRDETHQQGLKKPIEMDLHVHIGTRRNRRSRTAKPCTPVQFWSWPPSIHSMACTDYMRCRLSRRRTSHPETEPAAMAADCRWRRVAAAESGVRAGSRNPPPEKVRPPFVRRPATAQIQFRSSRSPDLESAWSQNGFVAGLRGSLEF